MKVLLLENISSVAASQFEEAGFEVESLKGAMDEAELVKRIRGVAILGARSKTRVTAAVLEAAPELVSVGAFCIGVDKIDRTAASDRGSCGIQRSAFEQPISGRVGDGRDHPADAADV